MRILFLSLLLVAFLFSHGQSTDPSLKSYLKSHVFYLSSDKLKGRATGSPEEELAMKYIAKNFKKYGLRTVTGGTPYVQEFSFDYGKQYGEQNFLKINGEELTLGRDYFVMNYSAMQTDVIKSEAIQVGYGIVHPEKGNDYEEFDPKDLKEKVFIVEYSSPDGMHPHSEFAAYSDVRTKVMEAIDREAKAILFINSDEQTESPKESFIRAVAETDLPVLFVKKHKLGLFKDQKKIKVQFDVDLEDIQIQSRNVVGYINNNSRNTVVLGAHYDHLGMGEMGSSRHTGEPEIHNGADDNASGVAAIIELARLLKEKGYRNNNYLFIAFSGEELGLYGSKYFVENPVINISEMNYMLNFDMVGRLNEEKTLIINGVGTSPVFTENLEKISVDGLTFKTTESGVGPSDHTSFYLKDLPALHFFSGTHEDYHKPSDDEHLINYEGLESIVNVALHLIEGLNDDGRIAFTKTKDDDNKNSQRFSVTLGVMPDYVFSGEGMKIDGVISGRVAEKAGIQKDDVLIKMGDVEVVDMMSYMKALSMFKKGDETTVVVKRAEEEFSFEVQF